MGRWKRLPTSLSSLDPDDGGGRAGAAALALLSGGLLSARLLGGRAQVERRVRCQGPGFGRQVLVAIRAGVIRNRQHLAAIGEFALDHVMTPPSRSPRHSVVSAEFAASDLVMSWSTRSML